MRWSTLLVSALFVLVHETRAFAPPSPAVSHVNRHSSFPFAQSFRNRTPLFTYSIEKEQPQSVGKATFSLIKAIVGSGVLAMPAGLAVATNAPKA